MMNLQIQGHYCYYYYYLVLSCLNLISNANVSKRKNKKKLLNCRIGSDFMFYVSFFFCCEVELGYCNNFTCFLSLFSNVLCFFVFLVWVFLIAIVRCVGPLIPFNPIAIWVLAHTKQLLENITRSLSQHERPWKRVKKIYCQNPD